MSPNSDQPTVVSASAVVEAPADVVFELIADPARQVEWDGNDNLTASAEDQRVRRVGDVFVTTVHIGADRENHVVELDEGRLIAWRPAEPGQPPVGHLWRWEVEPIDESSCRVTHTYDWTDLHDPNRLGRARRTSAEWLMRSIDGLRRRATGVRPRTGDGS